MNCPKCSHPRTAITGVRQSPERTQRARKCLKCAHTFTSVEVTGAGLDLLLLAIESDRISSEAAEVSRRCERLAARLTEHAKQLTPEP